jgi:RND family efflux transporter MFP subunit
VQDIEDYYDFTGNTAAVEQVEIRARVEGFLTALHFADGQDVNVGDLLFTIEPNEFIDIRNQAQAQLLSGKAELVRAQLDYERIEKAVRTNAVSEQDLSTAKANRDKAEAQVMSASAALNNANLNLSYTKITSPIPGRVSRRLVDPGNLVGANEQTLLATVVRMQPMYVYFNVSEEILEQHFVAQSPAEIKIRKPKFRVGFVGQQGYPYEGFLDYIDTNVDPSTGTIFFRGQVPNTQLNLLPGMFVRVRVPIGIRHNAILIEDRALNSDIGGKYVFIVDPNDVVHRSYVKIGRKVEDMRVIDSGVTDNQRYIVSGFHNARPGSRVTPEFENNPDNTKPSIKAEPEKKQ